MRVSGDTLSHLLLLTSKPGAVLLDGPSFFLAPGATIGKILESSSESPWRVINKISQDPPQGTDIFIHPPLLTTNFAFCVCTYLQLTT